MARQATTARVLGAALMAASLGFATAAAADDPRLITVSGEGRVAVAPDTARVNVGVSADATEASEAMGTMSEALAKVVSSLETAGIAKSDMQTGQLSLSPRYEYPPEKGPVFAGFTASSALDLRLRDLSALPSVLDTVVREGANTIGGISFDLSAPQEAYDEARRRAVQDAQARAKLYAEAAGVELGALLALREGAANAGPEPMLRMAAPAAADRATPVSIEGGEVNFSAYVTLVYEIKD